MSLYHKNNVELIPLSKKLDQTKARHCAHQYGLPDSLSRYGMAQVARKWIYWCLWISIRSITSVADLWCTCLWMMNLTVNLAMIKGWNSVNTINRMAYICHDLVHSVYDGIYICDDLKLLISSYFLQILSKWIYSSTKPNYVKNSLRWYGFYTWHIYMPFVHRNFKNVKTPRNQFLLNWMTNKLLLQHFCVILGAFPMAYIYAIRTREYKICQNLTKSIRINCYLISLLSNSF